MIEDARRIGQDLDKERKFATKLLHFGSEIDSVTGASGVPIYQASTFHHHDIFNPPQHDYSRSGNPTRQALRIISPY